MDMLTNKQTLLSVSRSAAFEHHDSSSATPTGEKSICDTSDNLDAIWVVDHQADDSALAPQVGAHGSYSFSMHPLTLPPNLCVIKQRKRNPRICPPLKMTVKLEVRMEARFPRT
jgi:hypothetical protein